MQKAILLTGRPGCGKTTLIQRVLAGYAGSAGGFYAREIRADGVRKGFEIITLDGRCGALAHVNIKGRRRVGKYGVDVGVMDRLAAPAVVKAVQENALVVIDEIGPMEMLSNIFCEAVIQALDSEARLLGGIVQRSLPFSDQVKQRKDVRLIEVHPGNRDALVDVILDQLGRM
jgi:nucleoside-triphosphatase